MNIVEVLKSGIKAIPIAPMIIAIIEIIVAQGDSINTTAGLFLCLLYKNINTASHIEATRIFIGNAIYCSIDRCVMTL